MVVFSDIQTWCEMHPQTPLLTAADYFGRGGRLVHVTDGLVKLLETTQLIPVIPLFSYISMVVVISMFST